MVSAIRQTAAAQGRIIMSENEIILLKSFPHYPELGTDTTTDDNVSSNNAVLTCHSKKCKAIWTFLCVCLLTFIFGLALLLLFLAGGSSTIK